MRSAKQTQKRESLGLRSGFSAVIATVPLTALVLFSACDKEAPKLPPAPAEAAKAPAPAAAAVAPAGDAAVAAKPKMVANPDGLSLADRIAKRQAAEAKVAAELAAAEKERLLKYDRGKLPLHQQVFAFILKTRAQYDAVEKKGGGDKGKADLTSCAIPCKSRSPRPRRRWRPSIPRAAIRT